MKVAVSASGTDLDQALDPRFGRCRYFIIVETDDMQFEVIENTSGALSGGAGIQAAQDVVARGVRAVLTGNCGPNAQQILSESGIDLHTGLTGSVRGAVQQLKQGSLEPATGPNVGAHGGLNGDVPLGGPVSGGQGGGRGMGMGGGRRMGGGGRCMGGGGRGMGRGGAFAPKTDARNTGNANSLGDLKARAADLQQRLEEIDARIRKIESS